MPLSLIFPFQYSSSIVKAMAVASPKARVTSAAARLVEEEEAVRVCHEEERRRKGKETEVREEHGASAAMARERCRAQPQFRWYGRRRMSPSNDVMHASHIPWPLNHPAVAADSAIIDLCFLLPNGSKICRSAGLSSD